MITFRTIANITEDRRVVLTLPPEVPTGKAELVVSVGYQATAPIKPPRSSLADWAESNAEHWGDRFSSADVESFTGRRF